jgi:hypothetical protein
VVSLLTPTITPSPLSQSVNSEGSFTEKVTVSGTGVTPTGTVTLTSGSYNSGPQTLVGGVYTFTIGSANTQSPLAVGTDNLTITYSGDSIYTSGTNTSAQVTITESSFKLTAGTVSPSSVTPGGSATVTVTVAALNGYTGIVTLPCAQSGTTASGGDGTTCTGSGTSQVNLATCGASCSVTFTVGTYQPITASLVRPNLPGGGNKGWLGAGSGAILALLVFFGIPARRRSWRNMLSILVVMVAIGTLASCGGGSNNSGGGNPVNDPGTTAGTYTYTINASANPSVTPMVTTTFTVTVN